MKKPRYLIFSIATVIMCVSCGITIIYLLFKISKYDFPVFEGILGIIAAICIMSLFITNNSLIERLAEVTEKVVELEGQRASVDITNKEED